jgi:RNA recognition motif-containing protein
MATKLFVGNLPFGTVSADLEELFSQVGGKRHICRYLGC